MFDHTLSHGSSVLRANQAAQPAANIVNVITSKKALFRFIIRSYLKGSTINRNLSMLNKSTDVKLAKSVAQIRP